MPPKPYNINTSTPVVCNIYTVNLPAGQESKLIMHLIATAWATSGNT